MYFILRGKAFPLNIDISFTSTHFIDMVLLLMRNLCRNSGFCENRRVVPL